MANQATDILTQVALGLLLDPIQTMAQLLQADELLPGAFELVMLAMSQALPELVDLAVQTVQQAAQQGDEIATQVMLIMQEKLGSTQLEQASVQSAKQGAKLQYIKLLLGQCPEGLELAYFKVGGKVCSKCVAAKKKVKKNCGGLKFYKEGGISTLVNNFRTEHAYKCGGKVSKKYGGDKIVKKGDWVNDTRTEQARKIVEGVQNKLNQVKEFLTKNTPKTNPINSKSNTKFSPETKLLKDRSKNFQPAEGKCGMKVKKTKLSTKKCGGKMPKKSCGGKTTKKC